MTTAEAVPLAAACGAPLGVLSAFAARRLTGRPAPGRLEVAGFALATAALDAAVALARHAAIARALGIVLVAVLVAVSATDLAARRIPNKVTGPAALLAVALGLLLHPAGVPAQLVGGLAAGGFLLVFAIANRRGLGMGDVKLAGVLGLYLGASVAVALFGGLLAAAAGGLVLMARKGARTARKLTIPLGPYLATGGVIALLWGPQLVHWYTHSSGH
jgi:leader peptidase (prepilin peptidase)/N-methyltransferase